MCEIFERINQEGKDPDRWTLSWPAPIAMRNIKTGRKGLLYLRDNLSVLTDVLVQKGNRFQDFLMTSP